MHSRGSGTKPLINPKQIQYANPKPLSANRKDRGNRSQMEYGESDNYDGGFNKFGRDTNQINYEKQKKRNGNTILYSSSVDFVSGLEEQIRLKSERMKKEREFEVDYERPQEMPSSSQSRRSYNPAQVYNGQQEEDANKRRSIGRLLLS